MQAHPCFDQPDNSIGSNIEHVAYKGFLNPAHRHTKTHDCITTQSQYLYNPSATLVGLICSLTALVPREITPLLTGLPPAYSGMCMTSIRVDPEKIRVVFLLFGTR